jgi:hypothetical protein
MRFWQGNPDNSSQTADVPEGSPPRLGGHLVRAFLFTVLFGVIGMVTPILIFLSGTVVRWIVEGASEFDRADDIHQLAEVLIAPVLGVGLVFAAAGWATYAPRGTYRFASTLLLVFVISVTSCFTMVPVFGAIGTSNSWRWIFIAMPPVVTALLLTVLRGVRFRQALVRRTNAPHG